jgi:hypothetical protein
MVWRLESTQVSLQSSMKSMWCHRPMLNAGKPRTAQHRKRAVSTTALTRVAAVLTAVWHTAAAAEHTAAVVLTTVERAAVVTAVVTAVMVLTTLLGTASTVWITLAAVLVAAVRAVLVTVATLDQADVMPPVRLLKCYQC